MCLELKSKIYAVLTPSLSNSFTVPDLGLDLDRLGYWWEDRGKPSPKSQCGELLLRGRNTPTETGVYDGSTPS